MTTPTVSVLLPVYNGLPYLNEAVQSVLEQSLSDFECIIIDDGSTDGSGALLEDFARNDARIKLIRRKNKGLVATLNEGLLLARAPLIARMDADDICLPQRLEQQVKFFKANKKLSVLGTAVYTFRDETTPFTVAPCPVGPQNVAQSMKEFCAVTHPSVMFRRDAVLRLKGYREVCRHAEDYDLWLRMLDEGHLLDNVSFPLLKYRIHENNVSVKFRLEQSLAVALALTAQRIRLAGGADPLASLSRTPSLEEASKLFEKQGSASEFSLLMLESLLRHFESFSSAQAALAQRLAKHQKKHSYRMYAFRLRCFMRALRGQEYWAAIKFVLSFFEDPLGLFKVLWVLFRKKKAL